MHIHEYQAKALFKQNGIKVPDLEVISNSNETQSVCKKLGGNVWVVKAQVHAGGRGKGGGNLFNIHTSFSRSEDCNSFC